MENFRHILFPVDFSPQCESTVPYVRQMMQSYHARLTLQHTVEIPIYSYGSMPSDMTIAFDSFGGLYKLGQQQLKAFQTKHFGDLAASNSIEISCDQGDPGYAILASAEKSGADLIMMSTYGHSPFRSFMLGSNTARVLHSAKCAVWTRAHSEQDVGAHINVSKILCAVDLEKESGYVLKAAVALSETFSAQVCLIHCVPVPEGTSSRDYVSEFDRFLLESSRQKLTEMQKQASTNLEVRLEGGSVSKVIRSAATEQESDIVIIGRGHVQTPFSRLRSNAYAIIRDTPCPVLSV
jgi:nucleotide-binding universal stress UspA family protein